MEKEYIRRRNYFIDKGFQTRFIIKFCVIVIVASLLVGFLVIYLCRDSTSVTIENTRVLVKQMSDFMFPIIFQTLIIVTVFSALSVIVLTLFTSHKIAGPLYRIKKEIELLKEGNLSPNFKIRKTDQLRELANSLSDLADVLREKHKSLKDKLLQLKDTLNAPQIDRGDIKAKLQELEDILNYFKV